MSNETKTTDTGTKKFSVRDLVWILIGLVAGIVIAWGVFTTSLNSSVDKLPDKATVETTATNTEAE